MLKVNRLCAARIERNWQHLTKQIQLLQTFCDIRESEPAVSDSWYSQWSRQYNLVRIKFKRNRQQQKR